MVKDDILDTLRSHLMEIRGFGVMHLAVFGSVVRDENRTDSDVDILVQFDQPVGLFAFVRLQRYLEELLGRSVDLVTPGAIRPEMREAILSEAVYAA